jgi:EmrB/QacA subfamily drug resistance transporter
MSTVKPIGSTDRAAMSGAHPLGWAIPVFIAVAQLMIALDATIMNVALPVLQQSLGFSDAARPWLITSYSVAFGSLLLLGGRLSDRLGHKRAFSISLLAFAAVSALGGLATGIVPLCIARAAQGACAAVLAPTALALIAAHAELTQERGKTFALFGAIAGSGGALGLLLGGVLTQHWSWRVCLWVNVPIAAIAAIGTRSLARGASGPRRSLDVLGALLVAAGIGALVAACGRLAGGQVQPLTWGLFSAAALSLTLFVWHEARARAPLLPLRLLRDRQRVGAYLCVALAVAGMLGLFMSLTYYFQRVRSYTPLQAGLAFLPLSAATFAAAQIVGRILPRQGARRLMVSGLLAASLAMLLISRLNEKSSYATLLLPAELLLGLGMGAVFTPALAAATADVKREDAGVAAAMVHAAQQIGGSIGVALLNAIATASALAGPQRGSARVYGYATAAWAAASMLAVAAALAAMLMRPKPVVLERERSKS